MNLNKAQIIGRVTRTPEKKALPSGVIIVNFSLATNRNYKDKDGNKQEEVEFVNCVSFGKQAETIAQYVTQGQMLYVEGRLKTNSWTDTATEKKMYKTEVIVENFQFGPKAQGDASSKPDTSIEYPEETISLDDIPF